MFLPKDAAEPDCSPILDHLKSELKKGVVRSAMELILTDMTDRITRQANDNRTRQSPALQAVRKTQAEQQPQKKVASPTPASPTLVQPKTSADSSSPPSQSQPSRSRYGSANTDRQPPGSQHRSEESTKQSSLQQAAPSPLNRQILLILLLRHDTAIPRRKINTRKSRLRPMSSDAKTMKLNRSCVPCLPLP